MSVTTITPGSDIAHLADESIAIARDSIGNFIAAYAAYMTPATELGMSANAIAEYILERDSDNVLPKLSTLNLYARVIRIGDSLALNSAADYALVYSTIARLNRITGVDLKATLAPLSELKVKARRKALPTIEPVIKANAKNATGSGKATSKGKAKTDTHSAATDALKAIQATIKVLKTSTLTMKEFEQIALAVSELGNVTKASKPKAA